MRVFSTSTIPFFVFVFALLTRLLSSQVPINTDETLWIERGALFFAAFLEGELEQTYLRHHPGVLNMWLIGGAFSVGYLFRDLLPLAPSLAAFAEQSSDLVSYLKILASDDVFPVEAYVQVRFLFAFVTAGCMSGIYWLTRRLLGIEVALLMMALLLLEPFFLAYQRFMTTDSHFTNFLWLALLAFLLYLHKPKQRRWLLLSSLCYGLGLLSKVTALLSLPAIGLWLLWDAVRKVRASRKVNWFRGMREWGQGQALPLLLWGIGVGVTCFVLWPVLWVDFWGTLMRLVADLRQEVGGHYQFFFGYTTDDPGWLYYPVVLAFRLSPALLIGSLAALFGLFIKRRKPSPHPPTPLPIMGEGGAKPDSPPLPLLGEGVGGEGRFFWCAGFSGQRILLAIVIHLLVLWLAISSQSSKLDRYIIPLIPGLAILAAAGWLRLALTPLIPLEQLAERGDILPRTSPSPKACPEVRGIRRRARGVRARPVVLGLIILLQLPIFWWHFPLHVTYFNPLLGGPAVAQKIIMIGNGELLEEAAVWLKEESNGDRATVASWYRQVLGAYYDGPTTSMWSDSDGKWRWVEGRYAVLYVNQIQRHLPFVEVIDYFTMQEPRHVIKRHGVDYAYIYDGPLLLPEEVSQLSSPTSFNFEDKAKLLAYDMAAQVPSGEPTLLRLYWEALEAFPSGDYFIFLRLRDVGDGQNGRIYHEMSAKPVAGFFPVDKWQRGQLIRDVKEVRIPPGTPPGTYQLELSFYGSDYEEQGGLIVYDEEATYGEWIILTSIEVTPAISPLTAATDLQLAYPLSQQEQPSVAGVRLLGYEWAEATEWRAGDAVPLTLLWQVEDSLQANAKEMTLRLRLHDGERYFERRYGHQIGEGAKEFATNELVRDIWEPYLPADAPSGEYDVELVAKVGASDTILLNLGQIKLEAREHNFEAPEPKFSQQADLGNMIRLLGYDLATTAEGGEQLKLIFYWQALDEIERNYTRFVHLLNHEGQLVTQRDSTPAEGALPTTTWITDEILSEVILLDLPPDLPAGDYQMIVGFYDPTTWQRLTTSDGVDHILLMQSITLR